MENNTQLRLVDGMNEVGGNEMVTGREGGSQRETLPTLQFCLKQDLLTGLHRKEKQNHKKRKSAAWKDLP